MSDAELVRRAQRGDSAAFGELVDRHRSAVYRAALAALRSHHDAEDAAQDAFVLAFQRIGGFRGDASFKTWLLTIAWHQAINRRRTMGRWWRRFGVTGATSPDHDAPDTDVAGSSRSPEEAASDGQLRVAIRDEIGALPRKLRDALLLAQTGEHSYDEIGTMLNSPVGTIKWRVSEARKQIRKGLRARGFTDAG